MNISHITERLESQKLSDCTDVLRIVTHANTLKEASLEEINIVCSAVSTVIAQRRDENKNNVVWVNVNEPRDDFLQKFRSENTRAEFVRVFRSVEEGTLQTDESDLIVPKDFQTIIGVHGYANGGEHIKGFAWLTSVVDNHQKGFITPVGTPLVFGSREVV